MRFLLHFVPNFAFRLTFLGVVLNLYPQQGQTHFIIKFINEKSNKIQEHIDYRFVIYDQQNKSVFEQGLHSGWGVEQAAYKFIAPGNYKAEVTINYILFAPVKPDVGKFNIVASWDNI